MLNSKALLVAALLCACGGTPVTPAISLAGDPWAGQINHLDPASDIDFAVTMTNVTQDANGDAGGDFRVSANQVSLAGRFAAAFVANQPAIRFMIKGYKPFTATGTATKDRIIGVANGSGFYGDPFAACRGAECAWMSAWLEKPQRDARSDSPNDDPGGGWDDLPDVVTAFR